MTPQLQDARWRAAVDAHMLGEASDEQRVLLETHEPQGTEHRAERAFLQRLYDEPAAHVDDAAIIEQAVSQALAEQAQGTSRPRGRAVPLLLAAFGGAAAAAAIALAVTKISEPGVTSPTSASSPIAQTERKAAPRQAIAQATPKWSIVSGVAHRAGAKVDTLASGVSVDVVETLCATSGGSRACLDPGARFATTATGVFQLELGRLELVAGQTAPDSIELGEVRVIPQPHVAMVIERQVAGWSIVVDTGAATVVESTSRRVVRSGESLRDDSLTETTRVQPHRTHRTHRTDPATRKTAGELLRLARQQRRDGDTRGALTTYKRLDKQYPKSAAARAAAVSAGQLYLERGEAKAALRAFRRYLAAGGGGLGQDAAYGEIRALQRLGRSAEAAKATSRFRTRYPESHYSAKLGQ